MLPGRRNLGGLCVKASLPQGRINWGRYRESGKESVMPYMLLITESPEKRRSRPAEEGRLAMEQMLRFGDGLKARGMHLAGDSLKSDAEGVRIEVRGGKLTVVDGPFAEAKEIVGGFFLIDCGSKEEAIAIASECPAVEWATVEVREIGPCYE